jgi:hypothetical protein
MKELLVKMGFKVYVDWDIDAELNRTKVDKNTAALLRRRMQASTSLIYLATEQATSSKWMPWELGYFDGRKPDKVVVLPLLDRANSSFPEQEYVSLYPQAKKDEHDGSIYIQRDKEWTSLKDFLKPDTKWNRFP